MLFAVDIDSTIAIDKVAFARFLVKSLNLPISHEILSELEDYQAFIRLPEVATYLASVEQNARYQTAFEQAKVSLEVLAGLHPIDGAAEGIRALMEHGRAAYYTSRGEEMLETTSVWLAQHGFPPGLEIISCYNFYIKYLKTFKHTMHTNEPVVLIDDNAEKIVKAWPRTIEKWPIIGKQYPARFTLVAYGFTQDNLFSHDVPFPVLALPSWEPEHIQTLLDRVLVAS